MGFCLQSEWRDRLLFSADCIHFQFQFVLYSAKSSDPSRSTWDSTWDSYTRSCRSLGDLRCVKKEDQKYYVMRLLNLAEQKGSLGIGNHRNLNQNYEKISSTGHILEGHRNPSSILLTLDSLSEMFSSTSDLRLFGADLCPNHGWFQ